MISSCSAKDAITLIPMTPDMYHRYFMEYENDPDQKKLR
jgi:hypothetical protein